MAAVDLMMSSLTAAALILIKDVADHRSRVINWRPIFTVSGEAIPSVVTHVRCPCQTIVQRCEAIKLGNQDHSRDKQAITQVHHLVRDSSGLYECRQQSLKNVKGPPAPQRYKVRAA